MKRRTKMLAGAVLAFLGVQLSIWTWWALSRLSEDATYGQAVTASMSIIGIVCSTAAVFLAVAAFEEDK